jgi:hypothetical protein
VPGQQPGGLVSGASIQYNIISDVPEPEVLALTATGGGFLLLNLKRRRQTNTR